MLTLRLPTRQCPLSERWVLLLLDHRSSPITAATIPTPPTAQSTFPAAPLESTRDAEAEADLAADPDADTLALSFSTSAAPLAKVGIVLTHDLLMLKLPVITAEVVDAATKVGRSFVLVVIDAVEVASETAEFEVDDAALESLEVAMTEFGIDVHQVVEIVDIIRIVLIIRIVFIVRVAFIISISAIIHSSSSSSSSGTGERRRSTTVIDALNPARKLGGALPPPQSKKSHTCETHCVFWCFLLFDGIVYVSADGVAVSETLWLPNFPLFLPRTQDSGSVKHSAILPEGKQRHMIALRNGYTTLQEDKKAKIKFLGSKDKVERQRTAVQLAGSVPIFDSFLEKDEVDMLSVCGFCRTFSCIWEE
ncbi:hypothetical protein KCU59_g156, partial [Aureobasidium melanogenum]